MVCKGSEGTRTYSNIMESIVTSMSEIPTMKWLTCRVVRSVVRFGDDGKGGCLKTCDKCTDTKKKSRDVDMLSYDECCDIPTNPKTVVSEMNMFFVCEKIIKYCGDDAAVDTCVDIDTTEVWLTERGGHVKVKPGRAWAETRENIQCC